jgi:hypothetical protein
VQRELGLRVGAELAALDVAAVGSDVLKQFRNRFKKLWQIFTHQHLVGNSQAKLNKMILVELDFIPN